jgi:hypothetical protein
MSGLSRYWVLASLVAGCKSVDDWSGLKRKKETTPVAQTDDGQIVAEYLATLDRLGRGGAGRAGRESSPPRARPTWPIPRPRSGSATAFVLAVPGHPASDPAGARALLGEALGNARDDAARPSVRWPT